MVARESKFTKEPIYAPHRKGEAYRIKLDAQRAKKILGWKSKISVDEGIKRVVKALK